MITFDSPLIFHYFFFISINSFSERMSQTGIFCLFHFVSCGDRGVLFICHCIDLAIWFFPVSSGTKKERGLHACTNQHYSTFRFNLTIKFNRFFCAISAATTICLGVSMHRRTHLRMICIHWTDAFGTHKMKILHFW